MSLLEELIENHLYDFNSVMLMNKFLYYISNNYDFIDYKKLNFSFNTDENYRFIVNFNDKYTQYVLTEEFKKVERLHKIYNLLGKDIIKKFNTLKIEHTITIKNTNDI